MAIDIEAVWDKVTSGATGVSERISRGLTRLFGSSNERRVRQLHEHVDKVNVLSPKLRDLSDQQLRECTDDFRRRLRQGETLEDIMHEAFAVCREASHRALGKGKWVDNPGGEKIPFMAHFDVQIMGGSVLHGGNIAEMVTGEGKTLVATLPTYLNAIEGKGVHVVTVNDYLARRDAEWMAPVYQSLGLTVGYIQSNMDNALRQKAYELDITYGTNNEFGFDYLRDNMKSARKADDRYPKHRQQVQGFLNYAVIDEVDNILIDEARTPLIISGPAHDDTKKYLEADRIARQLRKDSHFEIKEKEHTCHLTDDGVREAEHLMKVESFYTPGNMHWPHLIDQSLKAHHLYRRDKDYVVMQGEVVIVDEFTGRLMPGRHWSDGLHQAVEAKEGVKIKEESQTLATITLQNFFKLYKKLSGMTGTAMTEANEFWKIYKLDVVAIPTNRGLKRINNADAIFRSEKEKYQAVVDEIERVHKFDTIELKKAVDGEKEWVGTIVKDSDDTVELKVRGSGDKKTFTQNNIRSRSGKGRPILVGTVSIEKSEIIADKLKRRGVKHEILNAKQHEREADIVAQAGRVNAVTISTNMAGRGTDIILGGNPEFLAWSLLKEKYETRLDVPPEEWKQTVDDIEDREGMRREGRRIAKEGGLHIIGTERHESRRIDNQLRGRAGRQGDPGTSRFFLSLEDDLMRIFAGEWVKNMLTRLGMQEGEAIESPLVSRRVEAAQRKVEERNFETRKNLLEYDEVMDEQRKRVYNYRQDILNDKRCKHLILEMIDEQVEHAVDLFMDPGYGMDCFVSWVSQRLGVELDKTDFKGATFDTACQIARENAIEQASSLVLDNLEENLPDDSDPREWNWNSVSQWANNRWGLKLKDHELRKVGREEIHDLILHKAEQTIMNLPLEEAKGFLAEHWGARSLAAWVEQKLATKVDESEVHGVVRDDLIALLSEKARALYTQKEAEFPVEVGLARFMTHKGGADQYDREGLVLWANQRFDATLNPDEHRSKFRVDFKPMLHELSQNYFPKEEVAASAEKHLDAMYNFDEHKPDADALDVCIQWLNEELGTPSNRDDWTSLNEDEATNRLWYLIDSRYRPEMREMERMLLLQMLDSAWKDHLYAMDHLKSSIGLRGYAQIDPKVEYKREGMKFFESMWVGVADRVTDLVFKMEQADSQVIGSLWLTEHMQATHADATGSAITQQQEEAIQGTQHTEEKAEPIRNRGERVGRNDPCPCGSGKKYKQCCMRRAIAS